MFYGVANWNSYMDCLLYTSTLSLQVLQLYLRTTLLQTSAFNSAMTVAGGQADEYINENSVRMVTVAISVIPILLVYPFLQRFYTKGITIGAVKG